MVVGALLSSSCVSKKSFDELQGQKDELAMKLEKLQADFDATKASQEAEIASLKDANMDLTSQKNALDADLANTKAEMDSKISAVQAEMDDKLDKAIDFLGGLKEKYDKLNDDYTEGVMKNYK